MKKTTLSAAFSLALLAGCAAYYGPPPRVYAPAPIVVEVPVLPPEVILVKRPYYAHRGHHYYWHEGDRVWLYSKSRRGPWHRLPRSHYPKKFKYRGKWHEENGHRGRDRDRGRRR